LYCRLKRRKEEKCEENKSTRHKRTREDLRIRTVFLIREIYENNFGWWMDI